MTKKLIRKSRDTIGIYFKFLLTSFRSNLLCLFAAESFFFSQDFQMKAYGPGSDTTTNKNIFLNFRIFFQPSSDDFGRL